MTAAHINYDVADPDAAPRRRVTLAELRARRDEIYAIARQRKVRRVRVFGSVARDEASPASDLDLLVEMEPEGDFIDMSGFALDVEDLLGVFTQVATPDGLRPRIRASVLSEAMAL